MRLRDSLQMAWAMLATHRLRSSLTILGIAVGHGVLVATLGIAQGAKRQAETQLAALGANVIFVNMQARPKPIAQPGLVKRLSLDDVQAIAQQVPSVVALAPEIHSSRIMGFRGNYYQLPLIGSTPEFLTVRNYRLTQGRFLADADIRQHRQVVVIGAEIAERFFPTGNAIGQYISIDQLSFEVIGVLAAKGTLWDSNQDDRALIPLTTAANRIIGQSSPHGLELTMMTVSTVDNVKAWGAAFQIENLLRVRHQIKRKRDLRVNPQQALLKLIYRTNQGLEFMLMAIAVIALLLGGIGIANMMLISVRERRQEIGLRKALGAHSRDILLQFLTEASCLALSGGVVGIGLGTGSVMLIGALFTMPIYLSPEVALLALATSGSIGLFFGLAPAQSAAQLDPIVALKRL